MSAIDTEPFPRGALIAAATLIAVSLVATTAVRLERLGGSHAPALASASAPAQVIDVRFSDEPDGSVSINNSVNGQPVATLAPGTNGFIRSVMRGLVHDRKRRGIGPAQPFRIARSDSGRVTLEDPATGRVIDLDAFGETNRDAFAQLLPARRSPS